MKKLFLMFAVLAMGVAASAQTTRVIKGAVVDKNGNPLPGATVNAHGGSEVTTVDADGSFSMEVPIWLKKATAQYAGMKDKSLKVTAEDMIFRMKPDKRRQWFIIANYSRLTSGSYTYSRSSYYSNYSFNCDYSGNLGGLMFGRLGKWGWYGKFNVGQVTANWESHDSYYDSYNKTWRYYPYSGDYNEVIGTLTGGVTKRIIDLLHVYLGVGAGSVGVDDDDVVISPEIGLIGKIKNHYLIHFGYQPMFCSEGEITAYHTINLGIGYAF